MAFDTSRREFLAAAGLAGIALPASGLCAKAQAVRAAPNGLIVRLHMGIPEVVPAGQDEPYCQDHRPCGQP